MRTKDSSKKEAIFDATLRLITERGFHDTPTALIAKEAGVASGTLYLYFASKEKLLNQLYLNVKQNLTAAVMAGYTAELTLQEGLELVWRNFLNHCLANPVAFAFIEQFENSPLLDQATLAMGGEIFQPVYNLIAEAKARKVVKDIPTNLLTYLFFIPMAYFVKQHFKLQATPSQADITTLFQGCWNAIKR